MINAILARIFQKHRTQNYKKNPPKMPENFRGVIQFDLEKCKTCKTNECVSACNYNAITISNNKKTVDYGKCIFCLDCKISCKSQAISHLQNYSLSTNSRNDLIVSENETLKVAHALNEKTLKLFKRSLKLRQISAGGCNACELDANVLNTLVFDLARYGIQFVASPRHADGILVTGPVTKNMELALKKTYDSIPEPKIVIVVGACAINGGPFQNHSETNNGLEGILPIDLYIPGCPPHPITILDGLTKILDKKM